ncbi:MAG: hypothetical protein ACP5LX_05035 [Nitrososphaeria archaeon]
MTWNGVHFNMHTVIPWWGMAIYFIIIAALFAYGWKRHLLANFRTVDYVYMGLLAAILVIWNFFISPLIPRFSAITTIFYYPTIGELFILFLVAALIGKPGSVSIMMLIYTLLSDIFHYGFGGEPFWFIYEVTAYAILIDLYLIVRGKYMGTPYQRVLSFKAQVTAEQAAQAQAGKTAKPKENVRKIPGLYFLDGAVVGFVVFIAYNFWYQGFWATFVEGYLYTLHYVLFETLTNGIGGIVVGIILAPLVYYIKKVIVGGF